MSKLSWLIAVFFSGLVAFGLFVFADWYLSEQLIDLGSMEEYEEMDMPWITAGIIKPQVHPADMVTFKGTDILSTARTASGNAFTIRVPSIGGSTGSDITITLKNAEEMLLVPAASEIFINVDGTDAEIADFLIRGINGEVPDEDAPGVYPDIKYGTEVENGVPGVVASDGGTATLVTLTADIVTGDTIVLANTSGTVYITTPKIEADQKVIGVMLENKARAYLLAAFDSVERTVVNDVIDGTPVSITYYPMESLHNEPEKRVRVFLDNHGNEALTMGLMGTEQGRMRIYCQEKGYFQLGSKVSVWHDTNQDGKEDPDEMFQLADLEFEVVDWGDWKQNHPETDVYLGKGIKGETPASL